MGRWEDVLRAEDETSFQCSKVADGTKFEGGQKSSTISSRFRDRSNLSDTSKNITGMEQSLLVEVAG